MYLLAFFAMAAMASIHSIGGDAVTSGCGMFTCWWFRISFRMGCVCQCGSVLCYVYGSSNEVVCVEVSFPFSS